MDDNKSRAEAIEDILTNGSNQLADAYDLPVTLAKLLGLLVECPYVTTEMIEKSGIMKASARVAISRLRKRLKAFGIVIEANRTRGYSLADEHKNTIRAKLDKP